jgi:CheY-like chemotaxis protein
MTPAVLTPRSKIRAMSEQKPERRQGPDRRHVTRGGRRPGDTQGYAPLVLVADDDPNSGARCVAILARLRFAVAPAHSVEEAIRVMRSLHPNLIVARLKDEAALREELQSDPSIGDIPILALTPDNDHPDNLIDEIRRVLGTSTGAEGPSA